ncbi:hypothetical protein ACFQMA_16905 [Halosimplex aquaticum]|uniref:Uncharacterized protein n=1 Tax=Halosimplex aquaticum TaxID=3026162 RepID=A0ABD5YB15_9EURY|nr:hypothetical protein [Halosimplex aquaticum]
MGSWQTFVRFVLTSSVLFVLILGFSFLELDRQTAAGQEAFVVGVMALVPAVLTVFGAVVVISVGWDPF